MEDETKPVEVSLISQYQKLSYTIDWYAVRDDFMASGLNLMTYHRERLKEFLGDSVPGWYTPSYSSFRIRMANIERKGSSLSGLRGRCAAEKWHEVYTKLVQSGLSVDEFYSREGEALGVSKKTFYDHMARLKKQELGESGRGAGVVHVVDLDNKEPPLEPKPSGAVLPTITAASKPAAPARHGDMRISLPGGAVLSFPSTDLELSAARILKCLAEVRGYEV